MKEARTSENLPDGWEIVRGNIFDHECRFSLKKDGISVAYGAEWPRCGKRPKWHVDQIVAKETEPLVNKIMDDFRAAQEIARQIAIDTSNRNAEEARDAARIAAFRAVFGNEGEKQE